MDQDTVRTVEALETLYGAPGQPALRKVAYFMTPLYRRWIMASKFCVLSTVGPSGTDGSPRGDDAPVVKEIDRHTVMMPDWRGNNRLDSLRNIVEDGRVSVMFMVPGSNTVVRLNGQATLSTDATLRGQFDKKGRRPTTVIVIRIGEIYTLCARAVMRAGLWVNCTDTPDLPSVGEILSEQTDGAEGGEAYDTAWGPRAAQTMW